MVQDLNLVPSWCRRNVDSTVTDDHIVPKVVEAVNSENQLRPTERVLGRERHLERRVEDGGALSFGVRRGRDAGRCTLDRAPVTGERK